MGVIISSPPGDMRKAVYDAAAIKQQVVGTTATQTMSAKTLTTPKISGTPAADTAFGWDATQDVPNAYSANTLVGTMPRVLAVGVGTQLLTNSVTTDQDFTAVYTLPANSLFTNKVYRVTLLLEYVTGISTVTQQTYLKLGTTKVVTIAATDLANSLTRSICFTVLIFGRAAAGTAAATSSAVTISVPDNTRSNTVDQPVNLATNGALAITPGVTYSGTGSTESLELQAWMVEELN